MDGPLIQRPYQFVYFVEEGGATSPIASQFLHLINLFIMVKLELPTIQSQARQEIISILVYDGKIAAIKLYMKHVKCRLSDARLAVDLLAAEIEPGQASC